MKEIKLTKNLVALVDDEDYERINAFKWCASLESRNKKYYAIRWNPVRERGGRFKSQHVRMSHQVLDISPQELPAGHVIDHVNHNGLDCRRMCDGKVQLEIITQTENMLRSRGWKRKKLEEEISL